MIGEYEEFFSCSLEMVVDVEICERFVSWKLGPA